MPHAVLIEDDETTRSALSQIVAHHGFTVASAGSLAEGRKLLQDHPPGVIITDLHLPDGDGAELLREVEESSSTEVVLITGFATVNSAIDALRLGAFDYILKPVDVPHLKRVLGNLHRIVSMREEIGALRNELRSLGRFGRLVGASPAMQKIYDLIARIAPTEAPVLLAGRSGTGKELAALTLHDLSRRRANPFLAVNCGAIAPNMIESELFGHERGSFTGASQKHSGYFERANGGTLFLDEITEMPLDVQVKLLRVLESRTVTRVGGEKEIPVDVRIVAATNQLPEIAMANKALREDLYYRLKVFQVTMPPLHERGEDVTLLAQHFLQKLNQNAGTEKALTVAALAELRSYSWPGNVRELKNVIDAGFILADVNIGPLALGPSLDTRAESAAKDRLKRMTSDESMPVVALTPSLDANAAATVSPGLFLAIGTTAAEAERQLLLATLEQCGGHKEKTASMLGLSLKTVYNRLKEYSSESSSSEHTELNESTPIR
jgi:DNA-binding NtrC family response regulator